MGEMYKLPVYMPEEIEARPAEVLYALPNYHSKPAAASTCNGSAAVAPPQLAASANSENLAPEVELGQKQLQLIEQLKKLSSRLDAIIKAAPQSAASKTPPSTAAPASHASDNGEGGGKKGKGEPKLSKEEKKLARKAGKAEAINKAGQGTNEPAAVSQGSASTGKPWIITTERKSAESGQSLTANVPPALVNFKSEAVGSAELTVTKEDLAWVKSLAAVGEKRGVAFSGEVHNKAKGSSTFNVKIGSAILLKLKDGELKCRVSIWKTLGAVLGLYSFEAGHAIQATHQNEWFKKLHLVLSGQLSLDTLLRESSQFLSGYDTLSSHFELSLADLLVHSLLSSSLPSAHLPSNVEFWRNRVSSLL